MNDDAHFEVYNGSDPYVFVSYSHTDSAEVYADIRYLASQGYRIWLDPDIKVGASFDDVITKRIQGCTSFVVFLSEAAAKSDEVKDETSQASKNGKHLLPVFLEKTTLSGPLERRLQGISNIPRFEVPRDRYLQDLARALPEIVREKEIEELFKNEIECRLEWRSWVWDEELREPLLSFAIDMLQMSREHAGRVLENTVNYSKLRDLIREFLEIGNLPATRWRILINRCKAWKIPLEHCEQLVQTEAATRARELIAQGKAEVAKAVLMTAVGTLLPQSIEVKTLLEQLERQQSQGSAQALTAPPLMEPAPGETIAAAATASPQTCPPYLYDEAAFSAPAQGSAPSVETVEPRPDSAASPEQRSNSAVTVIDGGLRIEWSRVPAGLFLRGCPDEFIRHVKTKYGVRVDVLSSFPIRKEPLDEFWISRTPVTNSEFHAFVKGTGHRWPVGWRAEKFPYPQGEADLPVTGVTWQDAIDFAQWVGARLPTRAEYEKACRGTDGLLYPWGNNFDVQRCNTDEGGRKALAPVGAYPSGASVYSVLDLVGNVWEWAADEKNSLKMSLGGSYESTGEIYGAGFYDVIRPADSFDKDLGFRLACSDVRNLVVKTIEFGGEPA
jgi:formylglycine-generating enzyme required for sulfatase activity